jgi:hypothetical protein
MAFLTASPSVNDARSGCSSTARWQKRSVAATTMQMVIGIAVKIEPHIHVRIGSDNAFSGDFNRRGSRGIRHQALPETHHSRLELAPRKEQLNTRNWRPQP